MGAAIVAMGAYVPDQIVTNEHLSPRCGKSPAWIKEKTGIVTRRWAPDGCPTSSLALAAVADMTNRYPGALDNVSMILLATSTPDRPQPACAATVQAGLGLTSVPAFDIQAVCAGWLVGFKLAAALVKTEPGRVLLIAADKYSTILDEHDPTTYPVFGDGGGATIIGAVRDRTRGLRSLVLRTDGELADLVTVPAGGSEFPFPYNEAARKFQMRGREVRAYALETLPPMVHEACARADVAISDLGAVICHQPTVPLLEQLAARLGIDPALMPITGREYGNLGAASLPFTLVAADHAGLLVPGRPIALIAFGGGMNLGVAIYVP